MEGCTHESALKSLLILLLVPHLLAMPLPFPIPLIKKIIWVLNTKTQQSGGTSVDQLKVWSTEVTQKLLDQVWSTGLSISIDLSHLKPFWSSSVNLSLSSVDLSLPKLFWSSLMDLILSLIDLSCPNYTTLSILHFDLTIIPIMQPRPLFIQ